jgi:hypothetical protein
VWDGRSGHGEPDLYTEKNAAASVLKKKNNPYPLICPKRFDMLSQTYTCE